MCALMEMTDGDGGMQAGLCLSRGESPPMNTTTRSLVLINYFPDRPDLTQACKYNSAPLMSMVNTCREAAGKRWPNFIAVDFYKVNSPRLWYAIYQYEMSYRAWLIRS